MTQLRTLDLSLNMHLECLPNSISNLENLCGLFLQGCRHISCLPALEKLRALRVLNIQGCYGIRELPQDMECLVSLQYLYMMDTSILEIPKGVISKLRNLRCLHLHNCPSLQSEEVNCLTHLQEFTNCYDELHSFKNLASVCKGEDVIIPANSTFSFLKHLSIFHCDSMKKLLPQGLLQNLKNLDTLSVEYCRQLEVVIGGVVEGEEGSSSNTSPLFSSSNILYLPKLKHLQLKHLPELKSICNGREMICPSIEKISIWRCTNVKRMPSFLPINEATQQPSVPSSFRGIELHKDEKEWWESLELHNPNAKHILQSHIQWY